MSDKHTMKITKEAAEKLFKERRLSDKSYSELILRILEELQELREKHTELKESS